MAWVLLIVAGLLETGWAVGLKYSDGFRRPLPSALTAAGIVISMVLLSIAARDLPIGTPCPEFRLTSVDGKMVSRDDFRDQPLLVPALGQAPA